MGVSFNLDARNKRILIVSHGGWINEFNNIWNDMIGSPGFQAGDLLTTKNTSINFYSMNQDMREPFFLPDLGDAKAW